MGNIVSAVQSASRSGDIDRVRRLLDHHPEVLNDARAALLHYAALGGHEDLVMVLLDRGADVSLRASLPSKYFDSDVGITALECAIVGNHVGIVKRLLDAGASPHHHLGLAIRCHADPRILQELLDRECLISNDLDYLMMAALVGNVRALETLWNNNVRADLTNILDAVVVRATNDVVTDISKPVAWLLEHGADLMHIPYLIPRLVRIRCPKTFDVVVNAYRALMR